MLKIKDKDDLTKLKDYGFEYDEKENIYFKCVNLSEFIDIDEEIIEISVESRIISVFIDGEYYNCYTSFELLDIIYDLIQFGIVEKINEGE